MGQFITESEIYRFLQKAGFKTPVFFAVKALEDLQQITFDKSCEVVIKGEVDEVFHKSDIGLVKIESYSSEKVGGYLTEWKEHYKDRFKGLIVVEKVRYKSIKDMPCELFFSIATEYSYGPVARLGLGGIHSEFWATKESPIIITADMTVNEVLEKLSFHLVGHLWFGLLRQQEALITVDKAKDFIQAILKLLMFKDLPDLVEINPFVITYDDEIVALDGVGVRQTPVESLPKMQKYPVHSILHPKKIAIAGVSTKKRSFGNMILDNVISSKLGKENIYILREGIEEFEGCPCLPKLESLKNTPVDALIVALPPQATLEIMEQLCQQQSGAEVVYLVAGGIGDGADHSGHAETLSEILSKYRQNEQWTPTVIGPNSLGIILSELKFNSLFIPPEKLEVRFSSEGHAAFISQSGAFFITRLSTFSQLPLKYAFCVGNQLDLTVGQTLSVVGEDRSIDLFSLYIEGFRPEDLKIVVQTTKRLVARDAQVIIYKAGRTEEGSRAAAGHTGAMGGAYDLEFDLLKGAGAIVCESIDHFSAMMLFYSRYKKKPQTIGVVSNAGFETVNSADLFDKRLADVEKESEAVLSQYLQEAHLDHLVSVSNPFDITPMANEDVYLFATEKMLSQYDAVITSIVPLTERIKTENQDGTEFGKKLNALQLKYKKPLLVVVDSGDLYDDFRKELKQQGLLVFSCLEDAALLLN